LEKQRYFNKGKGLKTNKRKMNSKEIDDILNNKTFEFYEYLLQKPLSIIYSGIEKDKLNTIDKYATLLIDKFAAHSSSFFFLSNGVIEIKKVNNENALFGYDEFTINSIFRTLMETYATFNNLFVEPKTKEEKEFRILLWKLDGLNERFKFDIKSTDFENAQFILNKNKEEFDLFLQKFEQLEFFKNTTRIEINKIYNRTKGKYNWRFLYSNNEITPLNISRLIEHTCNSRGFINNYRFTSTHAHSTYLAIERFENYRGKIIPDEYVLPQMKLAIFLTCMMIYDICSFNQDAKSKFSTINNEIKEFIIGISKSIKETTQ